VVEVVELASGFGRRIRRNLETANALKQAVKAIPLKPREDVSDAVTALRFRGYLVTLFFLSRLTLPRTARTGAFAAVFPELGLTEVVGHWRDDD
jgi:hypothetical protein